MDEQLDLTERRLFRNQRPLTAKKFDVFTPKGISQAKSDMHLIHEMILFNFDDWEIITDNDIREEFNYKRIIVKNGKITTSTLNCYKQEIHQGRCARCGRKILIDHMLCTKCNRDEEIPRANIF